MAWDDWVFGIPTAGGYNAAKWGIGKLTEPGKLSPEEARRQQLLQEQAAKAGGFADYGEGGVQSLGGQLDTARQQLLDQAQGKLSYSKEALRQGLQQNQSAQRSMAASASPANAAMAARTAAINSGRLGSAMAGQSALAGIAEQQQAAKLYGDLTAQQRQQDMMAALQSRQNAMTGYGANQPFTPQPTMFQQLMGAAQGAAQLYGTAAGKK